MKRRRGKDYSEPLIEIHEKKDNPFKKFKESRNYNEKLIQTICEKYSIEKMIDNSNGYRCYICKKVYNKQHIKMFYVLESNFHLCEFHLRWYFGDTF